MTYDMLIANRGPIEDLVGLEVVGRAARLVLIENLNDEIDRVQERWSAADAVFEDAGHDVGVTALGVEYIEDLNVFQGPHKSLMAAPMTRFPNVSVTGYATRPGPGDQLQGVHRLLEVSLLAEICVAAGPVDDPDVGDSLFCETLVHRRIERTSEAVLATLGRRQDMLGTINRLGEPRGGIVNQSWTKKTAGGASQTFILHGARFQYAPTRLSARYESR